jgi:hypothetical protein
VCVFSSWLWEFCELFTWPFLTFFIFCSLLNNPVAKNSEYRLYVIYKLPQLTVLDFNKIKPKVCCTFSRLKEIVLFEEHCTDKFEFSLRLNLNQERIASVALFGDLVEAKKQSEVSSNLSNEIVEVVAPPINDKRAKLLVSVLGVCFFFSLFFLFLMSHHSMSISSAYCMSSDKNRK